MDIQTLLQIFSIIIVPTCSGIIVFLSWRNNRKTEHLKILQERLNEKKHEAYAEAVSMFYNILKDSRANRKTSFQKQMDAMTDIKREIFMYGSDDVFRAFNRWLLYSMKQNEDAQTEQFEAFLKFVLEIRKDLCGGETSITSKDILVNLTQNEEDAKKLLGSSQLTIL